MDLAPMLEQVFSTNPDEASYTISEIEGQLPLYLQGRYFLNGPASFRRGSRSYRHWLDGDGMVCSLRFNKGSVEFVNRFVRTRKRRDEEQADRAIYRTFGTSFPNDRLNARQTGLESPANVSAYMYGSRLLAFGEQGLPWQLAPDTLETIDEYTFGGRLNEVSPFSAHPKIDTQAGEMFNFGVSFSGVRPSLAVYRFDLNGELILRKRHPLDGPCSIHDFGISPTYACFILSPYFLDISKLRNDGQTVLDSLDWRPAEGTWLLIAARESGGQRTTIRIGEKYCLHFINVWEGEDRLIVDILELDEPVYSEYQPLPDLFHDVRPGRPVRYIVSTDTWQLVGREELHYDSAPDFATVDPRRYMLEYDDLWMLGISRAGQSGRKFFDQLAHCRWSDSSYRDVYQAPPNVYLGAEPILLTQSDSDDGSIICQAFDADELASWFYLFEPGYVSRGPVCKLRLREPIPLLFHASYETD